MMIKRMVIRPIRETDFEEFVRLVEATGGGLTNLPSDPDFLKGRLEESLHAFDPHVQRAGEHRYLFVMEDADRGRLAGISGIISKVGGFQPWYSYEVRRERFAFESLGIDHTVETLYPQTDYNGPSEICCLFLSPEYREGGLGRLLSLSRFHFMGEFSRRFDREVIAELRGVTGKNGRSPFWDSVGRHFFRMEFTQADFLSGLDDKEFLGALLPRHPLYVPLLPIEARAVIGKTHRETEPARRMLHQEGFSYSDQVDVFDAGPIVVAELGAVRSVRERRKAPVAGIVRDAPGSGLYLISNVRLDFRACIGEIGTEGDDDLLIDKRTAGLLGVGENDLVAFSPLRPSAEG